MLLLASAEQSSYVLFIHFELSQRAYMLYLICGDFSLYGLDHDRGMFIHAKGFLTLTLNMKLLLDDSY
jgi:hypothetical protein